MTSTALVAQPTPKSVNSTSAHPVPVGKFADPLGLLTALKAGEFGSIRRDDFLRENYRDHDDGKVELTPEEVTRLQTDMLKVGFPRINRRELEDAVDLVAVDDPFDSMIDWLKQLPPWDGVPRVANFLPVYLGTKRKPYTNAVGRYLWTAMVARILQPGCKVDMMPV